MLIPDILKFAAICCVVISTTEQASARPKGGVTTRCTCTCMAPSGIGGILLKDNTYNVPGACGGLNGRTCNVDNPNTGGVATGELIGCDKAGSSAVLSVSPFGTVERLKVRR